MHPVDRPLDDDMCAGFQRKRARLGTPLTQTEIKDLGIQIASAASTTLSTRTPIVSVRGRTYRWPACPWVAE
jgi:hypothetical protein